MSDRNAGKEFVLIFAVVAAGFVIYVWLLKQLILAVKWLYQHRAAIWGGIQKIARTLGSWMDIGIETKYSRKQMAASQGNNGFTPTTPTVQGHSPTFGLREGVVYVEQGDFCTRKEFEINGPRGKLRATVVLWIYPSLREVRRTLYVRARTEQLAMKHMLSKSMSLALAPASLDATESVAAIGNHSVTEATQLLDEALLCYQSGRKQRQPNRVVVAQALVSDSESAAGQVPCEVVEVHPTSQQDSSPPPWIDEIPLAMDDRLQERVECVSSTPNAPGGVEMGGQATNSYEVEAVDTQIIPTSERPTYEGKLLDFGMRRNKQTTNAFTSFCVVLYDYALKGTQVHWGADLERACAVAGVQKGERVRLSIVGETPSKRAKGRNKRLWLCEKI